MFWVLPILPELERRRPQRLLHLRFGDSLDLLRNVREGTIDAAITSARINNSSFDHVALAEARFVFVAAPELLRRDPFVNCAQANNHVLLDAHPDLPLFRYFLDAYPRREPWAFRRVQRLGTVAAIRKRVLAGAGVAVLPLIAIEHDLRSGRLVPLFPSVELRTDQFRLVWAREHFREHELRALADELMEGLRALLQPGGSAHRER
jgi:LysR family transcriptional regulator, glycine cleavage system transcriptional activator